jgi:hypothetical protein
MDTGPLTLLMNFIGPISLGIALLIGIFWRSRRRTANTDAATRQLYSRVEDERRKKEGD